MCNSIHGESLSKPCRKLSNEKQRYRRGVSGPSFATTTKENATRICKNPIANQVSIQESDQPSASSATLLFICWGMGSCASLACAGLSVSWDVPAFKGWLRTMLNATFVLPSPCVLQKIEFLIFLYTAQKAPAGTGVVPSKHSFNRVS